MSEQTHIAFVEDDDIVRRNYAEILSAEGFRVTTLATKSQAEAYFSAELPDLVLLDIELGMDPEAGYELCRKLRERSNSLPIVFLTSHSSDVDKISGMRLGADDYIVKDISTEYLVIRIRSLLARVQALLGQAQERVSPSGAVGALQVDSELMVVRYGERVVDLSLTQFWIVQALVKSSPKILSHDQLMQSANLDVEANTIVAHVRAIRAKFKELDPTFEHLRTERGIGYRWI